MRFKRQKFCSRSSLHFVDSGWGSGDTRAPLVVEGVGDKACANPTHRVRFPKVAHGGALEID